MSDNIAVLSGYTVEIWAANDMYEMPLMVKPGTDFDDTFTAWDMDEQEFIKVKGWLFDIEIVD